MKLAPRALLIAIWIALAPAAARADAVADSIHVLHARIGEDSFDAEIRARRWLTALEAAAAPESTRARALDLITDAMLDNGHWGEDAIATGSRAVSTWRRARGDSSAEVAWSLCTLGRIRYRRSEHEIARRDLLEGLAISRRASGEFSRPTYRATRYLANVEEELADYPEAERLYRHSVAMAESLYGASGAEYGNALNSLAVMCRKVGRWAEARELYEQALAIRERALGPESRDLVFNLNNLANLLSTMGDAAGAKRLYERDLRIIVAAYGRSHPYYNQILANLAETEATLGDSAAAIAHLREVIGGDSTATPPRAEIAGQFNSLGALEAARGDTAAARRDIERSLAMREQIYGRDHPETATTLQQLGELALIEGNAARAASLYAEATAIRERHVGDDDPRVAESLVGLGRAERALGSDSLALECALRAERIATDHVRLTARVLEERVALSYAYTRPSGFDLAMTLAAEHPQDGARVRRVWDSAIRSRALVLDEMAHRHHAVVTSGDPLTRALADSLARVSEQVARLLAGGFEDAPDSVTRSRVTRLRAERDRLEFALAGRSAEFRGDVRRAQAGYDSVAAACDRGDALVAFVRYNHAAGAGRPAARYLAFVRRAGAAPIAVPLGDAASLEPLVSRWCAELTRRPSLLSRAADEQRCRAAGLKVRDRVWRAVATACRGATRVLIVPDGALQRVSFAALPSPEGGYEAERSAPLQVLSAERDIVAAAERERPGNGLLALGAPDFERAPGAAPTGGNRTRGAGSGCEAFRSMRFEALPGARDEVLSIAKLWRGACADSSVATLLGPTADERSLRTEAHGHRVLHLATHAFFLGADCARHDRLDSLALEDPLLRAGFALAGANQRAHAADLDDGILTAAEVATLNLEGVEWAVLSGCETAGGEIRDGEGVLGLRRGFQIAGAHTLISSLWAVDDQATAHWMEALYRARFAKKLGTAEAMREAQRDVLRARRAASESDHPYYWAAFVAAGDWR